MTYKIQIGQGPFKINIEVSWNLFASTILDMVEIHIPKCSKNTNKQPPRLNKLRKYIMKNKQRACTSIETIKTRLTEVVFYVEIWQQNQ